MSVSPQTSLYETEINDEILEKKLEQREDLRGKASEAKALYEEANENARLHISGIDLGDDAPVRVGRFIIVRRMAPPKSVSFETEAKLQTKISLLPD